VIKKGDRVGSSEAEILQKLGIKPFTHCLQTIKVFEDGLIYDPEIMDLNDKDIKSIILNSIQNIALLSLGMQIPSLVTIPHLIVMAHKNILRRF